MFKCLAARDSLEVSHELLLAARGLWGAIGPTHNFNQTPLSLLIIILGSQYFIWGKGLVAEKSLQTYHCCSPSLPFYRWESKGPDRGEDGATEWISIRGLRSPGSAQCPRSCNLSHCFKPGLFYAQVPQAPVIPSAFVCWALGVYVNKPGQFHFPGSHRHCPVINYVVSAGIVYDRGLSQEVVCKRTKNCLSRRNSSCKWPALREMFARSRAWKVKVSGTQSTRGKVLWWGCWGRRSPVIEGRAGTVRILRKSLSI